MDHLQQCGVKTLLEKTKGVVFNRDNTVISYYKHRIHLFLRIRIATYFVPYKILLLVGVG